MCRFQIFLDETGCVLNEKMMPDLTVMVPELEIDRKVSKINKEKYRKSIVQKEKCIGPGMRVLIGGRGGMRSYHGRKSAITKQPLMRFCLHAAPVMTQSNEYPLRMPFPIRLFT
jgi:hypothetical protein